MTASLCHGAVTESRDSPAMDGPILAIAAFLVISTALHLLSSTAAAIRLRRGMAAIDGMFAGPVTIIRPLCGLENHLERTLRS
jgi:hypothetical protein